MEIAKAERDAGEQFYFRSGTGVLYRNQGATPDGLELPER